MGKPHPLALRERVVAFVEEGDTHRAAAAHFRVLIKFVNDMVKLKRDTGSLDPKPQGRRGHGRLVSFEGFFCELVEQDPDITLKELRAALYEAHGEEFPHQGSVTSSIPRLTRIIKTFRVAVGLAITRGAEGRRLVT